MQKPKIKDIILSLDNLSISQTLEYITKKAGEKQKKTFIVTVNPEIIMLMIADNAYEKVIRSADLRTVDGVGVLWAGKMLGKSFKGKVAGIDLVEKLSETVAKKPITVGFLGGRGNVAERTAKCLTEKYPGLKVSFALEEWEQNDKSTDVLFVAFGSPRQEKWIYDNLPKIPVRVAIGVGGSFDIISGRIPRAPLFVRNLGLEWLFRLIRQPRRLKRQLKLIQFVLLVIKERLFN